MVKTYTSEDPEKRWELIVFLGLLKYNKYYNKYTFVT